jgi:hypothetical protein
METDSTTRAGIRRSRKTASTDLTVIQMETTKVLTAVRDVPVL